MASNFATGQVTVADTATLIAPQNNGRTSVLITNQGTTDVYLGGPNVSTSTGQLLPGTKGASVSVPSTAPGYGIVASSTNVVSFLDS